jgi:hypothetical protein
VKALTVSAGTPSFAKSLASSAISRRRPAYSSAIGLGPGHLLDGPRDLLRFALRVGLTASRAATFRGLRRRDVAECGLQLALLFLGRFGRCDLLLELCISEPLAGGQAQVRTDSDVPRPRRSMRIHHTGDGRIDSSSSACNVREPARSHLLVEVPDAADQLEVAGRLLDESRDGLRDAADQCSGRSRY